MATATALGWLLVVAIDPPARSPWDDIAIGFIFGTIFGQTTLAGAWMALGPESFLRRLLLSLAWIALLPLSLAMNTWFHGGPDAEDLVLLTACLYGQWLLVQLPLWGMFVFGGLCLRHADDSRTAGNADRQFGIRQLMVFTLIVAVVLAVARMVAEGLGHIYRKPDAPILVFLAVVATVTTLPLLLAALLRHRALLGLVFALAILIGCTYWERSLLSILAFSGGLDLGLFVCINSCSGVWVLAVAGILRRGGYRLSTQKP